jgi:hypothetical protein
MRHFTSLLAFLFVTTLTAQAPAAGGAVGSAVIDPVTTEEMDEFRSLFEQSNVGYLHVYVDPAVDPLETYLFRGIEMGEGEVSMLPEAYLRQIDPDGGKLYASIFVQGIEEDLYLVRYSGQETGRIDQFAIRDAAPVHLKTLASLDCKTPGDCAQLDSYITDVNLDTRLDLIQISRENASDTDETRAVYTMTPEDRSWQETEAMDVPWEGVTFYKHPSAARSH